MADVPPVRRLYRSRTNRMISGVCGGLAEYFNLDPTLVRISTVVLAFLTGGAVVIAYLLGLIIIPDAPGTH